MRDDRERLQDIVQAIRQILSKTGAGRALFEADEMVQVWALHHLQVVGEAARCLSPEFKQRYPDDTWSKAAGMRHILVHHYFEIDADQAWRVIELDLPALLARVTQILGTNLESSTSVQN
ncbi:MAG: HepT-like ribonuclease domain-containing protein [Acidobacteriota bacterium]